MARQEYQAVRLWLVVIAYVIVQRLKSGPIRLSGLFMYISLYYELLFEKFSSILTDYFLLFCHASSVL